MPNYEILCVTYFLFILLFRLIGHPFHASHGRFYYARYQHLYTIQSIMPVEVNHPIIFT
jgi:hypothetical protein